MTLDLTKIKAAAMAATQQPWILNKPRPTPEFKDYISGGGEYVELDVGSHGGFGLLVWCMEDDEVSPKCQANAKYIATANPSAVLELIARLEAAESELNVCSIEYGDVRDSYLHYKEKYEAAEKDAAKYQELIYAVGRKFPNETRHETALKYIHQMEEPSKNAAMKESEK